MIQGLVNSKPCGCQSQEDFAQVLQRSEHKVSKHRSGTASSKSSATYESSKRILIVCKAWCAVAPGLSGGTTAPHTLVALNQETLGVFNKMTCARNSQPAFLGFVGGLARRESCKHLQLPQQSCSCIERRPSRTPSTFLLT